MNEMLKLEEKIKPLQSITDLAKKRIPGFSDKLTDSNDIDLDYDNSTSKFDKNKKQPIDPEKVLGSLVAFIGNKPLLEKHLE